MRRADRLFRLVQLLRARRFATGEQIAGELGVSKRTVYRDVADLQGSGIPIRGEAGVGYRLERGYELAPLIFTSDELESLVLGARIVAAWGDAELAAAVGSAMTKVEAVLPETLRRVVLETPFFAPGLPGASAMAGELALLRRAIGERRLVHFRYAREDGAESERDARPLGLYLLGPEVDARRVVRAALRLPELPARSHARRASCSTPLRPAPTASRSPASWPSATRPTGRSGSGLSAPRRPTACRSRSPARPRHRSRRAPRPRRCRSPSRAGARARRPRGPCRGRRKGS